MAIKKVFRVLPLLLVLIFVFQLIPPTSFSFEGINNLAENSGKPIFTSNYHNDIAILNPCNRKPIIRLSTTKYQGLFETQVYILNYSIKSLNPNGIIADSRQKIKNTISNYFHGSKYKTNYLFI